MMFVQRLDRTRWGNYHARIAEDRAMGNKKPYPADMDKALVIAKGWVNHTAQNLVAVDDIKSE
jgi:murein tripeptide amidase MpaA